MTKDEILELLDEFYYACKADENKGVHYFVGSLMSSFAEIAANPYKSRIETEIELIKEQTQKIKDENK